MNILPRHPSSPQGAVGIHTQETPPGGKIKIAIIGIGSMGKGLLYQASLTPEIDCVAIADINLDKAIESAASIQKNYGVAADPDSLDRTIQDGKMAVCTDGNLVAQCEHVDLVIEASNAIGPGLEFSLRALENGKHLVLMNAEVDLMFGPYLMRLAKKKNVVYTSTDGDQYGVISRIISEIRLWGFEIVMAGNIKGFLNRYADPLTMIPEAKKRNLDARMCTSYTDGTKLNVEMALLANAFNLKTLVPGMRGPEAKHVTDVFNLFDFANIYKDRTPCVDYILGAEPGGGVFVIGYCENEYQRSMLQYYKMGDGPFYLFYRPYHLCHIESMASVIDAFRNKRSLMQPDYGFVTHVFSYAKRDLKKGHPLDGIGGHDCYGLIENIPEPAEGLGLPICLSEGLVLKRDIRKDEKISLGDVVFDRDNSCFHAFFQSLNSLSSVLQT